jgi:outer membrane protein assembly factor BamB
MGMRTVSLLMFAATVQLVVVGRGNDWPRFRGPDGTGISKSVGVPTELSAETNLLWKVESLSGSSSPVIMGEQLFLTAFRGDERLVRCLDAGTGDMLWERSVRRAREEQATPPCGPATPTAVVDDANVYAFFPDFGLVCCSQEGEERWRVPLGPFHSFHGVSSSPVVAAGRVFVLVDQCEDSFLAAYDAATGGEVWKVARPNGPIGGYSTPTVRKTAGGKAELVVPGTREVAGYDVESGRVNWSVGGVSNAPISVPVVSGNDVFVCEPSFTDNPFKWDVMLDHDRDKDGTLALGELQSMLPLYRMAKQVDEQQGNGDGKLEAAELDGAFRSFVGGGGLAALAIDESAKRANARVRWTYRKTVPQVPSVLLYRGLLWAVNDGGILISFDPESGEIVKRDRLGHGSRFYASPVAADGRIFLIDTDGKIAIVEAGKDWKVASTSELGEGCYATPAISGGRMYVRGESNLFCFGGAATQAE